MTEIKYADVAELRALGVLQEINRLLLHPLGLALEVKIDSETGAESLGRVWDYRDDPEGIAYGEDYSQYGAAKAVAVANAIEEKGLTRGPALGYIIQPFPPEYKQLTVRVLEETKTPVPGLGSVGEYDEGEEAPCTWSFGGDVTDADFNRVAEPVVSPDREAELVTALGAHWKGVDSPAIRGELDRERQLDEMDPWVIADDERGRELTAEEWAAFCADEDMAA